MVLLAAAILMMHPERVRAQADQVREPSTIGSATMKDDGTIVLNLRATGAGVGDAQISYPPGSPHYAEVLRHIGGLQPGQSKLVKPWPEPDKAP